MIELQGLQYYSHHVNSMQKSTSADTHVIGFQASAQNGGSGARAQIPSE